jgi:peptide/nickel transport system substrate-binding protein
MTVSGYWLKLQRQRVSRRRLLAGAAAGLAIASACGSDSNGSNGEPTGVSDETPPLGTPVYGNRFKNGTSAVIDTLDPHLSIAAGTAFFPRIYNLLVAQSPVKQDFFYFDLAETYEQPDETTCIFTLRRGITIAPNDLDVPERDIDGTDIHESFERIRTTAEANSNVFVANWFASHDVSADGTTYTITTPEPYAFFLANLGQFTAMVPPRELLGGDVGVLRTAGAGGGAFSVGRDGYTEGERLVLNKNPNYYRTDPNNNDARLPYIDGMDYSIIADRAAQRTAFISQQIYNYFAESAEEADELISSHDVSILAREPTFWFVSISMNVERPPFDNPLVRKAVSYSVNRQQYIDLIYGGDAQANGLVHWPVGDYALPPEELDELQPFDPEMSKQLLAEAGLDVPLDVNVMFPANTELQEHNAHLPIFLEQMEAAGFSVNQDPQDLGTWIDNFTNKNYDMSLHINQIYETPETPLNFQHSRGPLGDGFYTNGLQDPEIDAAIDSVKTITDPEQLVQAVHDVQRRIYEAGPMYLPLVCPFSRTLTWNFVKNYPSGIGQTERLLNDWWIDL